VAFIYLFTPQNQSCQTYQHFWFLLAEHISFEVKHTHYKHQQKPGEIFLC